MSQTRPFEHVDSKEVFAVYQNADEIDYTAGSMVATLNSSTADDVALPIVQDLKALQMQAESIARCAARELDRRGVGFEECSFLEGSA